MNNIQVDQLTEYKIRYNETINKRQYLGNKMTQVITIYTASASCTIWNILKFLKDYNEYKRWQCTLIILLMVISCMILAFGMFVYLFVNHNYTEDTVSALPIKNLFNDANNEDLLTRYTQQEIDKYLYKNICDGYISAAIHNENMNQKIASLQVMLLNFTLINLLIIATAFCLIKIVF